MKEKLIVEIFILYYLTIHNHFMMEIRELVRYYLLAISVRFIILTRIVDESSIRNGGQKNALKKSIKPVQTCTVL